MTLYKEFPLLTSKEGVSSAFWVITTKYLFSKRKKRVRVSVKKVHVELQYISPVISQEHTTRGQR